MGQKDVCEKNLFSDNQYFADLVNMMVFHGKQVVTPDSLSELDSTELFGDIINRFPVSVQKFRDVMKRVIIKTSENCYYLVVGVENQTSLHYAMAVRSMLYDALNYTQQIADIAKFHEKQEGRKNTKDYFIGMRKTDKLVPVITIIVYWGPDSWDAPRSLHEMFPEDIPQEILDLVPDYKIPVLAPCEVENPDLFQTDLKAVIKALQVMNDKKALKALLRGPEFQSLEHDAAVAIQAATNLKIKIPEMKEVNMCEAVKEWREELLTEGKAEGHAEGEAKGKERTENMFAQLAEAMRKHNCPSEDFARVMSDATFREKMKQKYGIE